MRYKIFLNCQPKNLENFNLTAELIKRFFDHIFAYYDSPLPIGSDEIIKILQIWLTNPQCGHKKGQQFPIFDEITIKASPPIYVYVPSSVNF